MNRPKTWATTALTASMMLAALAIIAILIAAIWTAITWRTAGLATATLILGWIGLCLTLGPFLPRAPRRERMIP